MSKYDLFDYYRETDSYSLNELIRQNKNRGTRRKSFNCKTLRINYKPSGDRYIFLVRCKESYSSRIGHIVSIRFDHDVESIGNNKSVPSDPKKIDVKLKCSCPAFLYWGSEYISGQLDYGLDSPTSIFPTVRDPNLDNTVCKHIMCVKNKTLSTIRMKRLEDRYKKDPKNIIEDVKDIRKKLHFKDPNMVNAINRVVVSGGISFEELCIIDAMKDMPFVSEKDLRLTIGCFLGRSKFMNHSVDEFLNSLTPENFEMKMIRIGMIV